MNYLFLVIPINTISYKIDVIDTIYSKKIMEISDTIQPDLVKIYEKVIATQNENFNHILSTIGIIVTVLIILIAVFNITVAKGIFRRAAKKIFKKESIKFQEQYKNDLENIENKIMARSYLAMGTAFLISGSLEIGFWYFFRELDCLIKSYNREEIITSTNFIFDQFQSDRIKKIDYKYKEEFISIINKIPGDLNLSKEIKIIKDKIEELTVLP